MTTRKQGEYGEKHENREVKKEIVAFLEVE